MCRLSIDYVLIIYGPYSHLGAQLIIKSLRSQHKTLKFSQNFMGGVLCCEVLRCL